MSTIIFIRALNVSWIWKMVLQWIILAKSLFSYFLLLSLRFIKMELRIWWYYRFPLFSILCFMKNGSWKWILENGRMKPQNNKKSFIALTLPKIIKKVGRSHSQLGFNGFSDGSTYQIQNQWRISFFVPLFSHSPVFASQSKELMENEKKKKLCEQ